MGRIQSFQRADNQQPLALSDDELAIRQLPLRAIFALEILARCDGRLHRAAKIQKVSAAALSTQIKRLETALGVDVIKGTEADRRRFELTEEGRNLVAALRSALPALFNLSASFREATESTGAVNRRRNRNRRSEDPARSLSDQIRR